MPQTLLLADDSVTIQRVIELTFADEDITVIAVGDGDQAIARINAAPPDIVLADVGMPGKSGYEVAEHVKKTPHLAHIPVVLLTGAFEPVDQVKAAAVGCDGVLAKPFEPQLVIGRVRELLGRPAQKAAAVDPSLAPPTNVVDFLPAPPVERAATLVDFAPAAPAPEAARVEDYFDRLDAAFASFSHAPAAGPLAADPLAIAPAAATPVPDEIDWFSQRPQVEEATAPDVALAFDPPAIEAPETEFLEPEPEPVPQEPEPEPIAAAPEPAEPAPLEPLEPFEPLEPLESLERSIVVEVPATPRVLPSIADAFAAILSAEQNALGVRPEWPTPSVAPAPPASPVPIVTDDLVDRVARRVMEQLSDRVVRETVASLASDAAERLVREEIDRIKASIK